MIDQLRIVQYYCSIYSVVGPILMAALAPLTTTSESSRQITPFLSLISIHLAITLVCSNRSRSRKTLYEGLRFESDFYALFYRFQDARSDFGKTNEDRIDAYLKKYDAIRTKLYEAEVAALPTARDESVKRNRKGAA